jgi:hypothetical protein
MVPGEVPLQIGALGHQFPLSFSCISPRSCQRPLTTRLLVPRSGPLCIIRGQDGKIWFTESYGAIDSLVPKPGV